MPFQLPFTASLLLQDLIAARMDRPGESSHAQGHSLSADVNIYLGSESKYQRSTLELQGEAIVESGEFVCIEAVLSYRSISKGKGQILELAELGIATTPVVIWNKALLICRHYPCLD